VTVLKILVSYPDGFALMAELKRDMAILATSGPERTRRLAARVADLDIFSQALIERLNGGWRITDKGRSVLDLMEGRGAEPETVREAPEAEPTTAAPRAAPPRVQKVRPKPTPAAAPGRAGTSPSESLLLRQLGHREKPEIFRRALSWHRLGSVSGG
jgi:hypothetical protein